MGWRTLPQLVGRSCGDGKHGGSRVKVRDILPGNVSRTRFRMFCKTGVQAKFLLDVSVDHASVPLASNASGSGETRAGSTRVE